MYRVRVLIVDDELAMRAFVRAGLKVSFPEAVQIEEAGSGEMAMKKLAVYPCDIVICDWNMPGMKGTELLAWVKEQDSLKDTQFLMLTASHEKDIVMNAVELGVDDFIMKPLSADELSRRVKSALARLLDIKKNKGG